MSLLSRPFPLRTSTELGGYREAVPLPHRYGYAAGELVQFNDSRTEFLWADHAVVSIDEVEIAGQAVGDWDWSNTVDATGHAVAVVRFGQSIEEGSNPFARGRGKRRPSDGTLMLNPVDVIEDVLRIAGRSASLEDFRRECDAAGIEVGGTIDKADSTQTIIRSICSSIGAIFCPDMRGLARLWPEGLQEGARVTVRDGSVSAACDADDLVNDLTIEFAFEGDRPRGSVQLDAPDSVARFGRLTNGPLQARWITSARVAVAVGRRLLRQSARPVYAVAATIPRRIGVGDVVAFAHPLIPVTGSHVVLSSERALLAGPNGSSAVTARAPVGNAPTVRIVRQSAAYDPTQYSNATIETVGGLRILTLREENGQPIIGARVTLDGGIIAYTDAGGRVSFPVSAMPPGWHTLDILTTDGRPLTTEVLVA